MTMNKEIPHQVRDDIVGCVGRQERRKIRRLDDWQRRNGN